MTKDIHGHALTGASPAAAGHYQLALDAPPVSLPAWLIKPDPPPRTAAPRSGLFALSDPVLDVSASDPVVPVSPSLDETPVMLLEWPTVGSVEALALPEPRSAPR